MKHSLNVSIKPGGLNRIRTPKIKCVKLGPCNSLLSDVSLNVAPQSNTTLNVPFFDGTLHDEEHTKPYHHSDLTGLLAPSQHNLSQAYQKGNMYIPHGTACSFQISFSNLCTFA